MKMNCFFTNFEVDLISRAGAISSSDGDKNL